MVLKARFFDRVLTTIQKHRMLSKHDRVLVAVSGGPDSVALLHFLKHISSMYDLSLHVFHLNHLIRGNKADEDAKFVEALAQSFGVPVTLMRFDVPGLAKREKLSIEEAARKVRYELMDEVAAEIGAQRVALGHHADDQVETFLMRLIRGSGLEGLKSMLPVRGHFIRPFIDVTKEDILTYIEENQLSYRIDASNEDVSLLRNRIRHELVPLLTDYNPQLKGSLLKTIEIVREDQAHLDELTNGIFNVLADTGEGIVRMPIQGLIAQPVAIQRRLARRCIRWVKSNLRGIEFKHVQAILDGLENVPVRIELELPDNVIVFTEYERLVFGKKQRFEPVQVEPTKLVIPGTSRVATLGVEIDAEYIGPEGLVFEKNGTVAHLDAAKVGDELRVRNRRPGDSFKPFGMLGEKKLQDFFVDQKVPRRERDKVPIITHDSDIVWVAGFRIDERFRITEDTDRVLVLRMRRLQ